MAPRPGPATGRWSPPARRVAPDVLDAPQPVAVRSRCCWLGRGVVPQAQLVGVLVGRDSAAALISPPPRSLVKDRSNRQPTRTDGKKVRIQPVPRSRYRDTSPETARHPLELVEHGRGARNPRSWAEPAPAARCPPDAKAPAPALRSRAPSISTWGICFSTACPWIHHASAIVAVKSWSGVTSADSSPVAIRPTKRPQGEVARWAARTCGQQQLSTATPTSNTQSVATRTPATREPLSDVRLNGTPTLAPPHQRTHLLHRRHSRFVRTFVASDCMSTLTTGEPPTAAAPQGTCLRCGSPWVGETQRPSPQVVFPRLPPRCVRGTSSRSGGCGSRPRGRGHEGDGPRPLDLREQRRGLANCGEASTAVGRRIESARGRGQRAPLGASEEGIEHLARQDREHDGATFGATLVAQLASADNG